MGVHAQAVFSLRVFGLSVFVTERRDVDIRLAQDAGGGSFFFERHDEAVFADGESDAGSGRAAERFGEAVVASAAENGVLRAQRAVGEFEGGAGVVVEAADQAVVDMK